MIKIQSFKNKKPDMVRRLKEIRPLLYDQDWAKTVENFPVYHVWRGIKRKDGLRYDITVIPSKMLGKEFPKTKGHKHINNFQELITVLEGEAIYLAQWGKSNKIDKIEAIKAKKGDWIIYPSNCEHLTINPGKNDLIMANWIAEKCESDYSLLEKQGGAGYFYTKSGWIKNKNYKKIPKLKFKKPLKKGPKNLNFLKACK